MLDVQDLSAAYGLSEVLFGVSLRAGPGEGVALFGRNGAGKSTTLKCIMGLLRPTSGRIFFKGEAIAGLPLHRISRLGVGYVPEDRRLFGGLTVLENLEVGRRPDGRGADVFSVERMLEVFPALRALRHRKAGTLSGGEQQMLALARTLMGNPELLLLDEPSAGLAPPMAQALREHLRALKAGGRTILVAEQNVKFLASLADRAYVLEKGQIVYDGPMAPLVTNEGILRAHLAL
ncbi:MAG: ABC transporter ATP-binding protein, partial [Candidatus Methylomirabilales bacterium]